MNNRIDGDCLGTGLVLWTMSLITKSRLASAPESRSPGVHCSFHNVNVNMSYPIQSTSSCYLQIFKIPLSYNLQQHEISSYPQGIHGLVAPSPHHRLLPLSTPQILAQTPQSSNADRRVFPPPAPQNWSLVLHYPGDRPCPLLNTATVAFTPARGSPVSQSCDINHLHLRHYHRQNSWHGPSLAQFDHSSRAIRPLSSPLECRYPSGVVANLSRRVSRGDSARSRYNCEVGPAWARISSSSRYYHAFMEEVCAGFAPCNSSDCPVTKCGRPKW
jgi:hypothetical protein